MKRLCCAGSLALCSFAPALSAAAPLGATIRVARDERAADCPDAPELTEKVERILQRALSAPAPSDALEVEVDFTNAPGEYSANVRSLGAKPGERHLTDHGKSCAALGEAVSVAIALLLDKELAPRNSGDNDETGAGTARAGTNTAPSASNQATPNKKNRDRAAQSSSSDEDHARAFEFRAAVEGGSAAGLISAATPLLSEELGLRARGFVASAGFNAALPGSRDFREGSVRTTLLFGDARACYLWGARFSLGPCAGFALGRLHGTGVGYPSASEQDLTWSAASAGALAEVTVWGRVFFGASALVWLPTHRSSFSVQNLGTAWQSSTFAGSVALRLGFRIW
ncbi:MAG TPA: hypothetical protein VGM44_21495 [Polyangiaceae bacterium]|jgi:hypothetical protein